ncbi:hypothetical protein SUGI_0191660 [Cryptomeria japonica]|nr:hypothetical protein SUGI_0191660 [Cryptomeria japonica]
MAPTRCISNVATLHAPAHVGSAATTPTGIVASNGSARPGPDTLSDAAVVGALPLLDGSGPSVPAGNVLALSVDDSRRALQVGTTVVEAPGASSHSGAILGGVTAGCCE